MIKRIIKKLHKLYYTSSSARYIQYLRDNGVKVGDNTKVLDPKKIQVDISRPELLEISENVFSSQRYNHINSRLGFMVFCVSTQFRAIT